MGRPDVTGQDLLPLVGVPAVPRTPELCAAMTGFVPAAHPARAILGAALLLATVEDWVAPYTVHTDYGDSGSEVLWDLGIGEVSDLVRALLVDRINHAAAGARLAVRAG